MKTIKIIAAQIIICLLAIWPVLANLTVTVQPGYIFGPDETPTIDHLNLLGEPTIDVTGTLDGSTSLAAGSVNGILLADSVPDGVTIGFNGNVPRALQVLGAGIAGKGMTNDTLNTVSVNIDGSLAFTVATNAGVPFYYTGVGLGWEYNAIFRPWLVWMQSTNAPLYTNSIWGYTNVQPVTNIVVAGYAGPTLTATDTVPVLARQQQNSNTVTSLGAIGQFVDATHLKQIVTINLSGITKSNDVVTSLALVDNSGTYALQSSVYALTVTTNLTLTNLATRIAAAINGTVGTPQFTAVASGSNIMVFEPLYAWPQGSASVTPNFATGQTLAIASTSFNLQSPLVVNIVAGNVTKTTASPGSQIITSPTFSIALAGGLPPYTYAWTAVETADNIGQSGLTVNSPSQPATTITALITPASHGQQATDTITCTVTDAQGQISPATAILHFSYP